jgi:hypothetical protein
MHPEGLRIPKGQSCLWLPTSVDYPETGFETISLQLNDHTDRAA